MNFNVTSNGASPDFLQDSDVINAQTAFVMITSLFIPVIVVSNCLVFWATILCINFHTPINILFFSLCIADLITGLITIPLWNIHYMESTKKIIIDHKYACLAVFSFAWIGNGGSLVNLLFISIDRYIAVRWPAKYKSQVTNKKTIFLAIAIWIYIFIIAFLPMMGWNCYDPTIMGTQRCNYYITLPANYVFILGYATFYPSMIISFLLYLNISIIVYSQLQEFKTHYCFMTNDQVRNFKDRINNVKITLALMCMFIVLWLPYFLIAPFKYFDVFSQKNTEIMHAVSHIFMISNAFVNAPIYAFIRRDCRMAYGLMLRTPPWRWRKELLRVQFQTSSHLQYMGTGSADIIQTNSEYRTWRGLNAERTTVFHKQSPAITEESSV